MSCPRLFAVCLGGKAPGAHIEVHDVVFVASYRKDISDCHALLKSLWFGDRQAVHIDSYLPLAQLPGYCIRLRTRPPDTQHQRLYFVNLGGYLAGDFGEAHQFHFIVADSAARAKDEAKARWRQQCPALTLLHKDALCEVDTITAIDQVQRWYLHISPSSERCPAPVPVHDYRPL